MGLKPPLKTPNKKRMGYAVYHLQKGQAQASSLGFHIDRTEGKEACYKHADPSKKEKNVSLCHKYDLMNLQDAVNNAIANNYKGKKEIRKDAVKYISHILTGSHTDMIEIFSNVEKRNKWVQENYNFIAENFGKDNIVRFTIHLDEKTPHIHCVTVPITNDGRLSAKELVGNNKNLELLQDKYALAMQPFGMIRGVKSTRKHVDTKEFHKFVLNAAAPNRVKNNILEQMHGQKIRHQVSKQIEQIFNENEITPFSIKKQKELLKNEITRYSQDILEKGITAIKEKMISIADKGFDSFNQENSNNLAKNYMEQKKRLERMEHIELLRRMKEQEERRKNEPEKVIDKSNNLRR